MVVHGMKKRARLQREEGIWRCCSGRARMDALGVHVLVHRQPDKGIRIFCSGRVQMDVRDESNKRR